MKKREVYPSFSRHFPRAFMSVERPVAIFRDQPETATGPLSEALATTKRGSFRGSFSRFPWESG